MSTVFDTSLAHIIDIWLEAISANNDTSLMLFFVTANDIKTYNSFILLNKEDIQLFERSKSDCATTKLSPHHAKQVSNIRKYISFLAASGKKYFGR